MPFKDPEKERLWNKLFYIRNKEKMLAKGKIYRDNNLEKEHLRSKKYYDLHKELPGNREKRRATAKTFYNSHREKLLAKNKIWRESNSEMLREYTRNRLKNNLECRLRFYLRNRLRSAIRNNQKGGSAVRDLGCTIAELKIRLELQFQPGMTWENWAFNGWHIDHIIPLSSFDLTNSEEVKKACHYTNLQPMWAIDNLRKSNKV